MKNVVLALSLGAALAVPLSASAMAQSDNTTVAANHFLVVDAASGRTIATLLPVDGQPNQLRIIGSITANPHRITPVAPTPAGPLTIAQEEKARAEAYRAQFQIPESTP